MKKNSLFIALFFGVFAFAQETEKPVDTVKVYEMPDQKAEFPGGIQGFRNAFTGNFDTGKIKGRGRFTTHIRFTIEPDGTISNITATGDNKSLNKEAAETMERIKKYLWKPAKIDGISVKSHFNLPITMNFE
ncbi:MAG: energy transducer TonB [Flavobacteriaceae bacterium]|jgi:protein TonB|nr:energy transducer TonB [Flavobacteriaceae bacterium]